MVNDLRRALGDVKTQGQTTVPVSGLEAYLAEMEKIATANDTAQIEAAQREQAGRQLAHDFEVWKVNAPLQNAANLEMFKSVIEAGQTALKSAILINGGAAAALLAFLGNLLTKEAPTGINFPIATISHAMLIFVIGVGLAGLASGFRYLTQWIGSRGHRKTGLAFNIAAIVCGLASFFLFFWGGVEAYLAFR